MTMGNTVTLLLGTNVLAPAPLMFIEALKSLEVKDTDEGRNGFQITFSTGRASLKDISDHPLVESPLLQPFSRVCIVTTLNSIPHVLINGVITNQELTPQYEPGQSTMTVTGEDMTFMMDYEEKSETHPNQPDTAIVSKIISSYGEYGLVPQVIPTSSVDVPFETDRVPTQQGTDLSYIKELASLHDFVFYVEPTPAPG